MSDVSNENEVRPTTEPSQSKGWPMGLGLGAVVGAAIGSATGNMGSWLAMGVGVSVAIVGISVAFQAKKEK